MPSCGAIGALFHWAALTAKCRARSRVRALDWEGATSRPRRNCYERTLQDAGSTPCAGIIEARQVPAGVCPPVGREWPVGERPHP